VHQLTVLPTVPLPLATVVSAPSQMRPEGKMEDQDDVSFAKRIIQEVRPSGTWYWPATGLIYTLHHDVKVAVLENTPGPENYHYHERVSAAWNGAGWKVLPEMHEMKRSGGILVN
jgi:hypothetical protein